MYKRARITLVADNRYQMRIKKKIRPDKLFAFTLAEVMITIGVVGVVASVLIPMLINSASILSWNKSKDNFEIKLNEATRQMNVAQVLSTYSTNDAFVDEFQNYIKISKRCTPSNITECFVSSFKTTSGEVINTTSLSTGADLGLSTNATPLVGLQFINGTSAIFAFKLDCDPPEWTNSSNGVYSNSSGENRAYSAGSTTSCIYMLYDVNGLKGPNKIDKDIATFNATLATCPGTTVGSMCMDSANTAYSPASEAPYSSNNNYWAGARLACIAKSMRLPNVTELDLIYANRVALGIPSTNVYWTSQEFSAGSPYAKYKDFTSGVSNDNFKTSNFRARCVK